MILIVALIIIIIIKGFTASGYTIILGTVAK